VVFFYSKWQLPIYFSFTSNLFPIYFSITSCFVRIFASSYLFSNFKEVS
jgi:hypothetical protein